MRFGKGGAETLFLNFTSLNKKKYKIFVICMNYCAYKKELLKAGIRVEVINVSRALFAIFYLKKIIVKIIENKCQTYLISNINYTNLLCSIFIKKKTNLKLIAIEKNSFKRARNLLWFLLTKLKN